jgi:hypothetical protein
MSAYIFATTNIVIIHSNPPPVSQLISISSFINQSGGSIQDIKAYHAEVERIERLGIYSLPLYS